MKDDDDCSTPPNWRSGVGSLCHKPGKTLQEVVIVKDCKERQSFVTILCDMCAPRRRPGLHPLSEGIRYLRSPWLLVQLEVIPHTSNVVRLICISQHTLLRSAWILVEYQVNPHTFNVSFSFVYRSIPLRSVWILNIKSSTPFQCILSNECQFSEPTRGCRLELITIA